MLVHHFGLQLLMMKIMSSWSEGLWRRRMTQVVGAAAASMKVLVIHFVMEDPKLERSIINASILIEEAIVLLTEVETKGV
ncbi:hypothetical protein LINPERHAP1_LOCUS38905 [Linum perenne]